MHDNIFIRKRYAGDIKLLKKKVREKAEKKKCLEVFIKFEEIWQSRPYRISVDESLKINFEQRSLVSHQVSHESNFLQNVKNCS